MPTPPMASTLKPHHLELQALEAFLKHDVALHWEDTNKPQTLAHIYPVCEAD